MVPSLVTGLGHSVEFAVPVTGCTRLIFVCDLYFGPEWCSSVAVATASRPS